MLSYFLPTLYGSLAFPFSTQNSNLPKYQVANAVSANIEHPKPAALWSGLLLYRVPAWSYTSVQTGSHTALVLGNSLTIMNEFINDQTTWKYTKGEKGISCPCVEHLDLWNREEKPFRFSIWSEEAPKLKSGLDLLVSSTEIWAVGSAFQWSSDLTWNQSVAYSGFVFQLRCVATWNSNNLVVAKPNICWQIWDWTVGENQPRRRHRSLNQS